MTDRQSTAADQRKQHHTGTIVAGSLFLVPGLAISAWSLYGYLRGAGAPVWLSAGASAAVDGLGLFAAFKAHAFTERGLPVRLPRWITYAMVVASVYINWQHASSQHWSEGIHLLIALPAAAAAAAFEIILTETRATEREKHEPRERTRRSVKIDADIWVHHPFMVWGARRREAADRLRSVLPSAIKPSRQDTGVIIAPAVSAPAVLPAVAEDTAPAVSVVAEDTAPDMSALPAVPDTVSGHDVSAPADQGRDTDTDNGQDATDSLIAIPAQSAGRGRRGRTSPSDTGDTPADVASLVPAGLLSADADPSVAEVVRQVYRDEWDTGTIRAVVAHVLPDAKPDAIRKAIGRHKATRGKADTSAGQTPGQYL